MTIRTCLFLLWFIQSLTDSSAQHSNSVFKDSIPGKVQTLLQPYYEGSCVYQGESRTVALHFEKKNGITRAIKWTINDAGIFMKPFYSWKWDNEKGALVCDNGLVTIFPEGKKAVNIILNSHGFEAKGVLKKGKTPVLPYTTKDIRFTNGNISLAGSLTVPGEKGRLPAIVFLHGSGAADRWYWAPYWSDIFSRMGIVCLFFDKRGCGQSGGSWINASLDDLSGDANQAIAYLKTLPNVDTSKIGLWGFSQSGWIVSNCVETNPSIGFALVCSGGGMKPREIERYGYGNKLLHDGFKQPSIDSAMVLVDDYFDYLSSKISLPAFSERVERNRSSTWLKPLGIERVIPTETLRKKWSWVADWDPLPSIRKIRFPILVVMGEKDEQTNASLAAERWMIGLSDLDSSKKTIRVFEGANHGIRFGQHDDGGPLFWQKFAPGYRELVGGWMGRLSR